MYKRARLGLGYLPQSQVFLRVCLLKKYHGSPRNKYKDKQERKRELKLLLGEFSITHLRQASAITLSGGERRRVEIADV